MKHHNIDDVELWLKRQLANVDATANNHRWAAYKQAIRDAYELGVESRPVPVKPCDCEVCEEIPGYHG